MNTTFKSNFTKKLAFLGLGLMFFVGAFAQVKYTSKNNLSLVVSGTSTLHDWDMKSADGSFEATFTMSPAGAITAVSGISFTTNPTALKSGKGAMDKNAYKALKTAVASFQAASGSVSAVDATSVQVKAKGKLTIAGSTQDAEVVATCKVNADKSITVTGSKKISMKEFGMEPPSFMMGTIKTGNDVTLKFDLKLSH
ncbi:MAG: YceI family protein [Sediminibacterium sp.]|nr:YceI family protein [Sediminibacterium sp.]